MKKWFNRNKKKEAGQRAVRQPYKPLRLLSETGRKKQTQNPPDRTAVRLLFSQPDLRLLYDLAPFRFVSSFFIS